jgi:hypothetical protein
VLADWIITARPRSHGIDLDSRVIANFIAAACTIGKR